MNITSESAVGEVVAAFPGTSRVFEKHRIDYCCSGNRSIGEACVKKNLPADDLITQLRQATRQTQASTVPDWTQSDLTELIHHILGTHHQYLARELPRLRQMLSKVIRVHGDAHPESLIPLGQVFDALDDELTSHMLKEERVLFPLIQNMEIAKRRGELLPEFGCGSVNNPIRVMRHEHDNAGDALSEIRQLTDDYTPPEDACNTYRALFHGLFELEQDLHQHIHLENNILFPRAAELEAELS